MCELSGFVNAYVNDSEGFCFIFYLHLLVEGLWDTSQVHR